VIGLVCLAATAAAQQPSKKFVDEYQKGIDAYRLGKFADAKQHLEAAKALEPKLPGPWRFLGAIAQAEKRWADCIAATREAIRLNPQSSEIEATRKVHDECRISWGKPAFSGPYDVGQGAISIDTEPSGAAVELSGLAYGATPLTPRTLAVGKADIRLTKTGYLPKRITVEILPGVVTDVAVKLDEDPAAKKPDEDIPEVTTGWIKVETTVPSAVIEIDTQRLTADSRGRYQVEQGDHTVEVRAEGRETQRHRLHVTKGQLITLHAELRSIATVRRDRTIGGVAIGTGVGLAAAGAVTAILSLRASDRARDWANIERSRPLGIPLDESGAIQQVHTREAIERKVDDAERYARISNISYGVAAAAICVGAYFLIQGGPVDGHRERATLTVVPVLGGDQGTGAAAVGEVRW